MSVNILPVLESAYRDNSMPPNSLVNLHLCAGQDPMVFFGCDFPLYIMITTTKNSEARFAFRIRPQSSRPTADRDKAPEDRQVAMVPVL
jgi:hypothetical protein